ncbi:MAG: ABC transporter substrate-binding protein [Dehalococcoidales bacterium]|nr:ABC transporter substrate-binding protein [Dehalococcoidales bacterium]
MVRNGMVKKILFTLLALIIAATPLLLTGCSSGETKEVSIKVGLSLCYTGPAGEKGRIMSDGMLDAWKYINDELGGVSGHKVEVVWRDNEYNTAKSVTILNELIGAGCLFFATNDSTTMKASMETANRNAFPGIAVFSSPELTNPPKHIYAQLADYGDDWSAFAQYYLKNLWKGTGKPKMALLLLNNSTGAGAKQAAESGAAALGIEIVATEEHATTTISEIESLTRVKAKNPDVIYISSTPAPTAVIMKNMVELGMYPATTVGLCHAALTSKLTEFAGSAADGVYGVYPTVSWGDNVPGMAKMTEYCQKEHPQDMGNTDYITTWSEVLIQAEILRLAIKNVGVDKLTPENIEKYGIQKLNNFDPGGLHGTVNYTAGDNRLSTTLRLFKVESGKINPITGWIEAPKIEYNFQ